MTMPGASTHPTVTRTEVRPSLLAFPESLRRQFRTVLLAALDHPQPVEPGGRQRSAEYIGIGSMPRLGCDLQLFAHWMHGQGFGRISDAIQTRTDPTERQILHGYTIWHHLRRLRRRLGKDHTTRLQALNVRCHAPATATFLY